MMLGSLLADKIIPIGRLKAAIIANTLVAISVIPMMWLHFFSLIIGRLLLGFGSGLFIVIGSVYMAETVPAHKLSFYGTSVNLGIVVGLLITNIIQG
jgi:MFS family permease